MSLALIRQLALPILVLAIIAVVQVALGYQIMASQERTDTTMLMALSVASLIITCIDIDHILKGIEASKKTPVRTNKSFANIRHDINAMPDRDTPTKRFRQRVLAEQRAIRAR